MSNQNLSDIEILKARAQALATEIIQPDTQDNLSVLAFQLGQEKYGLENQSVAQVLGLKDLTLIPHTPSHMLGVINVHGNIISVFDIKKLLGITSEIKEKNLIDMVIVIRSEQNLYGVRIDILEGIISIPRSTLQDSLPTLTGLRGRIVKSLTNDQRLILDPKKFLQEKEVMGSL